MRISTVDVFCDKGESTRCGIYDLGDEDISVHIAKKGALHPKVTIFIRSLQDLANFKNSVLQAYEKFLRDSKDV